MSLDLARRTHRRMLAVVGVLVTATVAGLIVLWPASDELPTADDPPDALVAGTIDAVELSAGDADPASGGSGEMARVTVAVHEGPDAGETVVIETPTEGYPAFSVGDEVALSRSQLPDGGEADYFISDFQRLPTVGWLLALFVAAVVAIGRWQGLRSLLGLALSLVIVVRFIVPGILAGTSPAAIALVGSVAVMLVTLYLAHGVNEMTTTAVLGTTAALAITITLGYVFIEQGKLTGFSSEEATFARVAVEGLDLQGLVLAGLIIAALGVLDDVTVSQASTVFALHDTDTSLGWPALFGRAMRVGRDHIASTVNTLFLAYAGASLALLVLFSTGGLPLVEIVNSEILAEEIIKTGVGSLGLISAVPLTTALASTVAVRRPAAGRARRTHGHRHTRAADGRSSGEQSARPPRVGRREGSDDDAAYDSWVRYLREGSQGDEVPRLDDDDPPSGPGAP